jgi:hypothetical protein
MSMRQPPRHAGRVSRVLLAAAPLLLASLAMGCTDTREDQRPGERSCPDRKPLPLLY